MQLSNTTHEWGSISKLFHWLIALLIVIMLFLGFTFGIYPKSIVGVVYNIHKSLGVTILFLMILRLAWRLANPTPRLPETTPHWQKVLARTSHTLLYILLIATPLCGWIMSTAAGKPPNFWWIGHLNAPWVMRSKITAEIASDVHTTLAITLSIVLAFHFLGALKHHFIDRDTVLKRMWFKS